MSTPNPYSPPQSIVTEAPQQRGSAVKAVVLGLVADFGGTFVGVLIFWMLFMIAAAASGAASGGDVEALIQGAAAKLTAGDSWPFYVNLLIGTSCSVFGGYVCARVARHRELRLGALMGAIVSGSGLFSGPGSASIGLWLMLLLAGMGAVMAGAWLGLTKNRRDAAVPGATCRALRR